SGRVSRAPLPSVPDRCHGNRYRPKLARLGTKPAHQPARVVDTSAGHSSWAICARLVSNCHLDGCTDLDGSGLHNELKTVRTHSLPLHRSLLSRDDSAGSFSVALSVESCEGTSLPRCGGAAVTSHEQVMKFAARLRLKLVV